ncbi:hypothetical protein EC988_000520 [Linderina pennispora]|nr:hypothetical protein EC988_000520 [Linderina pennispora]
MASTLANRLVDGDRGYIRVKRWLSKIALSEKPATQPDDYEPSISDDTTLYTGRPRTLSNASEDSAANIGLLQYQMQQPPLINSAQVDVAIALAVRARQEDRAGNTHAASDLFAAALERMALALQDIGRIENVNTRERLTTLKLLLESSCHLDPSHNPQFAKLLASESTVVEKRADNAAQAQLQASDSGLSDSLKASLASTLAAAMSLFNQVMAMWLVFLGNVFVWAAVQFKNSQLPEMLGHLILQLAAWVYGLGVQLKVHEHVVAVGQHVLAWAVQLDKKTHFSGRLWLAAASMLSALARVVEESSTKAKTE